MGFQSGLKFFTKYPIIILFSGAIAFGQSTPPCTYDTIAPSVEHARTSFKKLDHVCAERELKELLVKADIDLVSRSNAYALLAAICFAGKSEVKASEERRDCALNYFRCALRLNPKWNGELDIKSDEFKDIFLEAKRTADTQSDCESRTQLANVPVEVARQPSLKKPLMATGLFAASMGAFALCADRSGSRWDEYILGDRDSELYSRYSKAYDLKFATGIVSVITGVVAGYFWWEFFHRRAENNRYTISKEHSQYLLFQVKGSMLTLIFSFE